MTNEDQQQIAAILRDALDRAVESIANDFTDLREEMAKRFDRIDLRFDTVERRLDRVETNTNALLLTTAGISKS